MPGLNGIQTAEKILAFDERTPIIFVTTTEDFALQSYRVLAFDYLLKPVTAEAMAQCHLSPVGQQKHRHYCKAGDLSESGCRTGFLPLS